LTIGEGDTGEYKIKRIAGIALGLFQNNYSGMWPATEIHKLYAENMRLSRELNTALTAHIAALREIADLRVENEKLRKKEVNRD
jgi:hypothetical protein